MPQKGYNPDFFSITDDVTTPSTPSNTSYNNAYPNNDFQQTANNYNHNANPQQQAPEKTQKKRFSLGLSFFTDTRWRVVLGIIFIILSAFLFISVISYFFSAVDDQSELEGTTLEQVVQQSGGEIKNWGGPGGALISHKIVTHGLGIGVLPLLIYFVVIGLALLDIRKCNFWSATFKALLLAVTLSMVAALLFLGSEQIVPPGGYHGYYMNMLIIERFGWPGAIAVSLILIACIVGVYFYDLLKVYRKLKEKWDEQRERRRALIEQRTRIMQSAQQNLEGTHENTFDNDSEKTEEGTGRHASDIAAFESLLQGENPNDKEIITTQQSDDEKTEDITTQQPDNDNEDNKNNEDNEDNEDNKINENNENPTTQETDDENTEDTDDTIFTVKKSEEITTGEVDDSKLDPTAELSRFRMPTADLLTARPVMTKNVDIEEIEDKKNQIIEALNRFNIGISSIEATVGPTVTMYEIVPAEGVKIATIKRLEEDIAMALAALSTRIIAPIPGKSAIGIEVPNRQPRTVDVKTLFSSRDFLDSDFELPLALGVTIDNRVYMADLAKMPHLLVAGATGKGKSVGMNVIINSLLMKKHPSELKLVLIDPKMVEFYPYRKIVNHYLAQVPDAENAIITDTSKVIDTLNSLCVEMDDRYELLQKAEVVKITHYNDLYINKKLNPEKGHHFMPYIVVIVDEYADLLMTAGKEIEKPIARLAQKARAVGIHVIIATQRPSANIITGVIKGNFPARIAFKVTSNVDSNIILGNSGAFQLIGNGDMLVSQDGELQRVQCAFISTDEIKAVAQFIGEQAGFGQPMILPDPPLGDGKASGTATGGGAMGELDPLIAEIAKYVVNSGQASTSNIQRNYSVGYNRAGRIMDQLQGLGIVGAQQGSKPRDILVDIYRLEEILREAGQ